MVAFPERRFVRPLMLLSILIPLSAALPANVPAHKPLAAPSQRSKMIPRLLSRREIFQAIQTGLAQRGISGWEGLQPEDLKIQSSLPVLTSDVGLHLARIRCDAIRREAVIELRASHEPQYLPFEVRVHDDDARFSARFHHGAQTGEAGGGVQTTSPMSNQLANQGRLKPPFMAKPGRPATLVMLGQHVRVTTIVVPLQPGSRGQSILVRDPATKRVMTAKVVDDGLLETAF